MRFLERTARSCDGGTTTPGHGDPSADLTTLPDNFTRPGSVVWVDL